MFTRTTGNVRRVLLGVLCACAAACGDGMTEPPPVAVTPPNTPLTAHEAVWLFDGLKAVFGDTTKQVLRSSVLGDTVVYACPVAGRVTVTEDLAIEVIGDTMRAVSDLTATPDGCRFSYGGQVFQAGGPSSAVQDRSVMDWVIYTDEDYALVIEGHYNATLVGRLDWRAGHRFGSCNIDLVTEGGENLGAVDPPEIFLVGTMCGQEVRLEVEGELTREDPPESMMQSRREARSLSGSPR